MQQLISLAKSLGCDVEENPVLAKYTTFHIGGQAPLLMDVPASAAPKLLKAIQEMGQSVFWMGKGSNLLISDKGISQIVLRLKQENPIRISEKSLTCDGAAPLIGVCKAARDAGLSGLEFAYGIPGSVGGGVFMNAGAYGGEIQDVFVAAKVLFPDGSVDTIFAEEMDFGYRHSALMEQGGVVLEATFLLTPKDKEEITKTMEDFLSRRKEKQPLEYASAGSFFRRPTGYYTGALIEQCGLKGFRVGDAAISEKHAGFLVNLGSATCQDVKAVANEVKRRVLEKTGVTMQPEVRLIGETWEE